MGYSIDIYDVCGSFKIQSEVRFKGGSAVLSVLVRILSANRCFHCGCRSKVNLVQLVQSENGYLYRRICAVCLEVQHRGMLLHNNRLNDNASVLAFLDERTFPIKKRPRFSSDIMNTDGCAMPLVFSKLPFTLTSETGPPSNGSWQNFRTHDKSKSVRLLMPVLLNASYLLQSTPLHLPWFNCGPWTVALAGVVHAWLASVDRMTSLSAAAATHIDRTVRSVGGSINKQLMYSERLSAIALRASVS